MRRYALLADHRQGSQLRRVGVPLWLSGVLALAVAGCGGGGTQPQASPTQPSAPATQTLQITPGAPSLPLGTTQQFKAIATSSNGTTQDVTSQVTWSAAPAGVASITPSGSVTASGKGSFNVTGVLGAVTTGVSGTVTNPVAVSLALQPNPITLAVGGTAQLSATAIFTDKSTQDVTSSTVFSSSQPAVVGINNTGLVDAATAGQAQVAGTYSPAPAAQALVAQSVVTVNGGSVSAIAVLPANLTMATGVAQQFTAAVTGGSSAGVSWSVDGVAGGNAATGTISSAGLYASPTAAGAHTITASEANQSGSAQINVAAPDLTADFGSRSGGLAIAPQMLGAGLGVQLQSAALPAVTGAGLTDTRFHARIQDTYATSTPDWTELDTTLAALQGAGMHAILEVDFTPPSLLPAQTPCPPGTDPNYASPPPTDMNAFAQMAASYVTYIDQNFPGVVQDYEIWNEPDGGGLCTSPNTQSAKLSAYLSIYAAVAPALKAAAQQDGVQIRVGGPTLGSPVADAQPWLSALLSDARTAPYVDFVSFHYYAAGAGDVSSGLTWYGSGTQPSLLNKTQDASTGFAAVYKQVDGLVRSGAQPGAASTPIYMDEYNSDWAFLNDCCRNDPTYAPLWNSLAIVDLLNSTYSGASAAPTKLLYYAVSNPPFCLLGQIDAQMDCDYPTSGAPQPYPQYYAFQLFASPSFLGLANGASLAHAVSSSTSDLVPGAFYGAKGDTVVIVNPSSHDHGNVTIFLQNPGMEASQATVYTLNSSNPAIATSAATLSTSDAGDLVTVAVPQQSTVAVTLQ